MELTTKRLMLRPYRASDYPAIRAIDADELVQQMRGAGPITEQQSREWFEYLLGTATEELRTRYQFGIARAVDAPLIGFCKLVITNVEWREAEIGYALSRAAWGHGYATEAANALLGFGFDTLRLHRITAGCWANNVASARVMEKIGMRREAHFQQSAWILGSWQDVFQYAILEDEWRAMAQP